MKQTIIILFAAVAVLYFASGWAQRTTKTPEQMTDEQLNAAIDSLVEVEQPLTAAPLISEAKKRAAAREDTKWMLSIIRKEVTINRRRLLRTVSLEEQISKDMASAWTPLKQMLSLAVYMSNDDEDMIAQALAEPERLRSIKAVEVVDDAELDGSMTLYDYIAMNIVLNGRYNGEERLTGEQLKVVMVSLGDFASSSVELPTSMGVLRDMARQALKAADDFAEALVQALRINYIEEAFGWAFEGNEYAAMVSELRLLGERSEGGKALARFVEANYKVRCTKIESQLKVADANRTLDTAIVLYGEAAELLPTKELRQMARSKAELIQKKEVSVGSDSQVLPGQYIPVFLRYRNVSEVVLKVYEAGTDGRLVVGTSLSKTLSSRRVVASRRVELPAVCSRISKATAYTELNGVPAGDYVMAAYVDGEAEPMAVTPLLVSSIGVDLISSNAKRYLFFSDAQTGRPLPGLTLDGKPVKDPDGWADPAKANGLVNGVAQVGSDRLRFSYSNWRDNRSGRESESEERCSIVTDRAIYRPGQKVMFKLFVYTAYRDRTEAQAADLEYEVQLQDEYGEVLSRQKLKTNSYGAMCGVFDIPDNAPKGRCNVVVVPSKGKRIGHTLYYRLRIEDYKRTDNTVSFDPIDEVVLPGSSVNIGGVCMSASGLPVVNASVRYEVRTWGKVPVAGTAVTDDEGRFAFSYDSQMYEDEDGLSSVVSVSVTDSKGETASAQTTVNVTADGSRIGLEALQVVEGERVALKLSSENSNGRPYASKVKVSVYEYEDAGPLKPIMSYWPDTVIGESHQIASHSQKVGRLVLEKEYDVKGTSVVSLDSVSLSPRKYRVVASTTSAAGRPLEEVADLMVVAKEGRSADLSTLTVETLDKVYAGDSLSIRLSSGLADARVMLVVSYGGKMAVRQFVELSQSVGTVKCPIPSSLCDGDKIDIVAMTRKDGRRYQEGASVDVKTRKDELDLRLTTFRDHSQPGSHEAWTLETGKDTLTEIVASMYDARLDKYVNNRWNVSFNRMVTYNSLDCAPIQPEQVRISGRTPNTLVVFDYYSRADVDVAHRLTEELFEYTGGLFNGERYEVYRQLANSKMRDAEFDDAEEECIGSAAEPMLLGAAKSVGMLNRKSTFDEMKAVEAVGSVGDGGGVDGVELRTDFSETVFFMPELHPDSDGVCRFEFDLPDNLTTYAFRAIAHDKSMRQSNVETSLVVCKALNVRLGVPRFVVEGDTIEVAADIQTNDDSLSRATVSLAYSDAESGALLGEGEPKDLDFSATHSQRAVWRLVVPSGVGSVRLKCVATSGKASDGEQYDIAVERRNIEVAESHPFTLIGKGRHEVKNPYQNGETKALTFTYTSNAFIEVLRSLPYLDKSRFPSSDTYIGRFETSAIASYLKQKEDIVKAVDYLRTNKGNLPHTLDGGEGTPWQYMAQSLRQHDKDVVRLMSGDYAEKTKDKALSKLSQMQLPDGSFPWFKGMDGSQLMTVAVVSTFGELIRLGVVDGGDDKIGKMIAKALPYLDGKIAEAVADLKERQKKADDKEKGSSAMLDYTSLNLLYARSLASAKQTADMKYLADVLRSRWQFGSMSCRVAAATVLCRMGDRATADIIVKSLVENLERGEGTACVVETGLFHSSEELMAQSMLIMTLGLLDQENEDIQLLVNHLILRKHGEHWDGTQTTSRAVLALLSASSHLEETDAVSVGGNSFKTSVSMPEVKVALPNPEKAKSAKVTKGGKTPAWGSWQRISLSPIDQLEADSSKAFGVVRTVEVRRGDAWLPADSAELRIGDQLRVSLTMRNDKPLSFVRLTDRRASSLEPVDKLSGYRGWWFWRWTNADVPTPPHYMSIGDTEVDFFIEHLEAGMHQISYQLTVTHAGTFAGGYASGVCLYTPEIKAHSAGGRLKVGE